MALKLDDVRALKRLGYPARFFISPVYNERRSRKVGYCVFDESAMLEVRSDFVCWRIKATAAIKKLYPKEWAAFKKEATNPKCFACGQPIKKKGEA